MPRDERRKRVMFGTRWQFREFSAQQLYSAVIGRRGRLRMRRRQ